MSTDALITVKDLVKSYGQLHALNGVSTEIKKGISPLFKPFGGSLIRTDYF